MCIYVHVHTFGGEREEVQMMRTFPGKQMKTSVSCSGGWLSRCPCGGRLPLHCVHVVEIKKKKHFLCVNMNLSLSS